MSVVRCESNADHYERILSNCQTLVCEWNPVITTYGRRSVVGGLVRVTAARCQHSTLPASWCTRPKDITSRIHVEDTRRAAYMKKRSDYGWVMHCFASVENVFCTARAASPMHTLLCSLRKASVSPHHEPASEKAGLTVICTHSIQIPTRFQASIHFFILVGLDGRGGIYEKILCVCTAVQGYKEYLPRLTSSVICLDFLT
jgi:hypothetical protein